jgi:hypothetical protein
VLQGIVRKYSWKETESFWLTLGLTVLTLDIYPLLGGAITWPEGSASFSFSLRYPGGKTFKTYQAAAAKTESLSMYRLSDDTPGKQLMKASAAAAEKLVSQIIADKNKIVNFAQAEHERLYPTRTQPRLAIKTPLEAEKVKSPFVRITGEASDTVAMGSVTVAVNGKPVKSVSSGRALTGFDFTVVLRKKGINRLQVTAVNSAGMETSLDRVVSFEPPEVKQPRRYAAVIALSDTAASRRLGSRFASSLGIKKDDAVFLGGKAATIERIEDALITFIKNVPADAELFVYYSGEVLTKDNASYLKAADTKDANIAATAFPLEDLSAVFRVHLKAKRAYVFLDARGAGGLEKPAAGRKDLAIFTTKSAGPHLGRAIFDALSYESDTDKNGIITFGEFKASLMKSKPKPVCAGDIEPGCVFAVVRAPRGE